MGRARGSTCSCSRQRTNTARPVMPEPNPATNANPNYNASRSLSEPARRSKTGLFISFRCVARHFPAVTLGDCMFTSAQQRMILTERARNGPRLGGLHGPWQVIYSGLLLLSSRRTRYHLEPTEAAASQHGARGRWEFAVNCTEGRLRHFDKYPPCVIHPVSFGVTVSEDIVPCGRRGV